MKEPRELSKLHKEKLYNFSNSYAIRETKERRIRWSTHVEYAVPRRGWRIVLR